MSSGHRKQLAKDESGHRLYSDDAHLAKRCRPQKSASWRTRLVDAVRALSESQWRENVAAAAGSSPGGATSDRREAGAAGANGRPGGSAVRGERLIFRSVDRLKLIGRLEGERRHSQASSRQAVDELKKLPACLYKPQHAALLVNYPLRDRRAPRRRRMQAVSSQYQPLPQKNYFGEKVALYFGCLTL